MSRLDAFEAELSASFWSIFLVIQMSTCVAALLIYLGHYYRTRSWPGRAGVWLVFFLTVLAGVASFVVMNLLALTLLRR